MLGKRVRIGLTQKKILLFLQAGLALGLSHSPKQQAWILNQMPRELEKINRQTLNPSFYSLYHSHLIEEKEHKDGSCTFFLSHEGKEKVLRFNIEEIKIKKSSKWDKKWRIVMFDIPEKQKRLREAIRFHLKDMGLVEFQKSVFISPYPCENELEFVLEYYNARRYIRFILADKIDNSLHFEKKFNLT